MTSFPDEGTTLILATLMRWLVERIYLVLASHIVLAHKKSNNLRKTACLTLAIWMCILIGSAVGMALPTRDLDQDMQDLLQGASRVATSVFLFFLSMEIPQWMGIYYYCYHPPKRSLVAELSLPFVRSYFLMLLFLQGTRHAWSIPVAWIMGILVGGTVLAGMIFYHGQNYNMMFSQSIRGFSYVLVLILGTIIALASFVFAAGIYMVCTVWMADASDKQALIWSTSVVTSLIFQVVVHGIWYQWSLSCDDNNDNEDYMARLFARETVVLLVRGPTNPRGNKASAACQHGLDTQPTADESEDGVSHSQDAEEIILRRDQDVEQDDSMPSSQRACCRCWSHLTWWRKILLVGKWILCISGNGLCIFLILVNLGATHQAKVARSKFPAVHDMFYEHMNEGPVCAFTGAPYQDATISTFASPPDAYQANATILHCGACGACSTWQNLQANWETRNNLAKLARECAKKLIFGTYQQALDCHLDTIGFDEACSECWIEDERCAISNCVFISFQSNFLGNVGNFAVQEDGPVTSAYCDEAICGPDFVPCSGATRRRMNIESDIARPANQQCTNVEGGDAQWIALFGE